MEICQQQTEPEYEKYVVISDLHGRHEHLKRVYDRYDRLYGGNMGYVHAGDAIHSSWAQNSCKETIQTLIDIGAVCLYGNHEWNNVVISGQKDDGVKYDMIRAWKHHQGKLYQEYGVGKPIDNDSRERHIKAFDDLDSEIRASGHDKYFASLKTYFEPKGMGFVALHAGLIPGQSWYGAGGQKESLDSADVSNADFEPPQIFSFELSTPMARMPEDVSNITVLSGHDHIPHAWTKDRRNFGRMANNRVFLGSNPRSDGPIYVWESWTKNLVEIYK